MPGKNRVDVTFAGDSTQLERAFANVGAASRQMESTVEGASRSAADSLDRFGEAADNVDTRAMGFRDTLTGLQDSMASTGELAKGDFFEALLLAGFGIGDLASGIYNFAAPALKNLVERLGAAKLALAGVGVAAAVAGLITLVVLSRQAKRTGNDVSKLTEDFERFVATGHETVLLRKLFTDTGTGVGDLRDQVDAASNGFLRWTANISTLGGVLGDRAIDPINELDTALAQLVDSGADAETVFNQLTTTYGLNADQTEKLRALLPQYGEAAKRSAERTAEMELASNNAAMAVRRHTTDLQTLADALRAQTDPVFAYISAQRDLAEAQTAVNEAGKEFGVNSQQYRDAILDLAGAQLGLVDATARVKGATDAALIPALQRLRADGHLSEIAFQAITRAIDEAKAAAERLDGTRIKLRLDAQRSVDNGGSIPWGSIPQFHSGGVMPGAPGSEGLALLQAGEVISKPGTGAGAPVVIQVGGSGLDRMFLSWFEGLLRSNNLRLVRG